MTEGDLSRRRLLCGLGAGLATATAGCLGSGGSGGSAGTDTGPSGTPTRTETPSPTPTASTATPPDVETPADGACEPLRPTPNTPGPDGLEPEPYPDLPADATAEAAESFASAFERAFTTNAVVAGTSTANVPVDIDRLALHDGASEVHVAGSGHLVEVSFSITYEDDVSDETPLPSGETPSPAPTGHTSVAASYYVTDRFALRRGRGELWAVVACA